MPGILPRINFLKLLPALSDNRYGTGSGSDAIANDSISTLVAQCTAGDRRGQKQLFTLYRKNVYTLCYRFLGPGHDLDDVVQQVFIKIFRSLEGFKGLSSLDTWIYRITHKVCIDQLRAKYRKRKIEILDDSDQQASDSVSTRLCDPYQRLENRELAAAIYQALNRLSEEKRSVVVLFEMESKSLEEIARILDKPVGTIKSRLFHARNELETLLKRQLDAL